MYTGKITCIRVVPWLCSMYDERGIHVIAGCAQETLCELMWDMLCTAHAEYSRQTSKAHLRELSDYSVVKSSPSLLRRDRAAAVAA